jgi:glycosyltransferase involved in cell wall biosynthesis
MKKISIIIPAKNSGKTLGICLQAIAKQTHKPFEVIVIDDNSSKEGFLEHQKLCSKYGFKLVKNTLSGRSTARNEGIKMARGDYILFLDSDQEIAENTLEECIKSAEHYDLLSIKETNVPKDFWSKVLSYEFKIWFWGTNRDIPRFYKSSILKKIGGYDPSLEFGEDWDLAERARRVSSKESVVTTTMINHHINARFFAIIKKHYIYGRYIDQLMGRHKGKTLSMYKGFNFAIFSNIIKYFFKNPFYTIMALFIRFVKYSSIALGYAVEKLRKLFGRRKK